MITIVTSHVCHFVIACDGHRGIRSAHLSPRSHNLSPITTSFYTLAPIIEWGPIKDRARLSRDNCSV